MSNEREAMTDKTTFQSIAPPTPGGLLLQQSHGSGAAPSAASC
jgi:hypothetical protein